MERDPQSYAILGAAMEAHRQLGHGFLEAVYQAALAIERIPTSEGGVAKKPTKPTTSA